jgi:hypothetical protein
VLPRSASHIRHEAEKGIVEHNLVRGGISMTMLFA